MCGRYVSPDEASIEREFTLVHTEWQFPPSYNVAPTQNVPVVRLNKAGERIGALMHEHEPLPETEIIPPMENQPLPEVSIRTVPPYRPIPVAAKGKKWR